MKYLNDWLLKYFLNKWVARKQFESGRHIKLSKNFYVTVSQLKEEQK